MAFDDVLQCPDCHGTIQTTAWECESCGHELRTISGIPSFIADTYQQTTLQEPSFASLLADKLKSDSIRKASHEILRNTSDKERYLNELFECRYDAWRMLVGEYLEGHCLDLHCGFGRRSLLLAEILDSVVAVDSNIDKLRVLTQREDFESRSRVTPVHGDLDSIRLQADTFDVIVGDFTGTGIPSDAHLNRCQELLGSDGTLLLLIDGPLVRMGLGRSIGVTERGRIDIRSVISRKSLNERLGIHGFEAIDHFTLFPTYDDLSLMFDVNNKRGIDEVKQILSSQGGIYSALKMGLLIIENLGVLDWIWPNSLVLARLSDDTSVGTVDGSIMKTGRSRSTSFKYSTDLQNVRKIPNRKRHSQFNVRENKILRELVEEAPEIRSYLPDGSINDGKFGVSREEVPIRGDPLSTKMDGTWDRLKAIEKGLNWIVMFQQPSKRERIQFPLREYIAQSPIDFDDEITDNLPERVEQFICPVHGDFLPGNIYVQDGEISTVTDWEYGDMNGIPMIDAGFYVVRLIGGSNNTSDKMLHILDKRGNEDSQITRSIRSYCDRVGLTLRSFYLLLPIVYFHRVLIDRRIGATSTYTIKETNRINIITKYWYAYYSSRN